MASIRAMARFLLLLPVLFLPRATDATEGTLAGAGRWQTTLLTANPTPPVQLRGQQLLLPKAHLGRDYLLTITVVDAGKPRFLPILFAPESLVHFTRVEGMLHLIADPRGQGYRESTPPTILATFPIQGEDAETLTFDLRGGSFGGYPTATARLRSYLPGDGWMSFEAFEQFGTSAGPVSYILRYTLRALPAEGLPELPYPLDAPVGYFTTPRFLPGLASPHQMTARWDIRKPIIFSLSANTPAYYRQAITDGVLAWNGGFDREVVHVDIAPAGVTPGDPRYNLIQWVEDDELGLGLGWSTQHPLTGETLQGLIIITSGWATIPWRGMRTFGALPADPLPTFEGLRPGLRCVNDAADLPIDPLLAKLLNVEKGVAHEALALPGRASHDVGGAGAAPPIIDEITRRRLALLQLRAVIMHEVGHVLGLRHNFAGSLGNAVAPEHEEADLQALLEGRRAIDAPLPSGSIMDYNAFKDDVRMERIGAYDRAAIAWAYGTPPDAATLAALRYCTDEAVGRIADCQKRDHGTEPIDWWVDRIAQMIDDYYDWILANTIVPIEEINTFTPDDRRRGRLLQTIGRGREAIDRYRNPHVTVWYLNDRFPNERRAIAAQVSDRFGADALPPPLAAVIRDLTAKAAGDTAEARWARFTLETIGRYLADLHGAIGR